MSKTIQMQKRSERIQICGFLRELGFRVSNPCWQEQPDALLTIRKGKAKKRIAIEHTDYFNNTVSGEGSPLSRISDFWRLVQDSLVRRISHRKHLTGLGARVRLLKLAPKLPKLKDAEPLARKLAADLVNFLEKNPIEAQATARWSSRDFQGHPELQSRIERIRISRRTDDEVFASRCSWICDNLAAGFIRLKPDYIKSAVSTKNEKAKKYQNWGDANEKWLLISASGINVGNHAGPSLQSVDWADSDLLALCQSSPFDKIVFWERIRSWHKWIKPNETLVQL